MESVIHGRRVLALFSVNRLTFHMSKLVCHIRNIHCYHWIINHSSHHIRHFRFLKDESQSRQLDSEAAVDEVCRTERFVVVLQTTLTLTASAGVMGALVPCIFTWLTACLCIQGFSSGCYCPQVLLISVLLLVAQEQSLLLRSYIACSFFLWIQGCLWLA